MSDTSNAAFVQHWERLGALLADNTRREQRRLSDTEHLQAVANVLALARPEPDVKKRSGLVDQQRLFREFRR
ncbi:MAG: hypothetical protein AAF596_06535 [Planctomycetota bacterium]